MTKKDIKEPRYSLQEMIVYLLFIFIVGNSTGAAVFSRGGQDSAMLQRIERKVERLEACVTTLKDQFRDMKLKIEIKKK